MNEVLATSNPLVDYHYLTPTPSSLPDTGATTRLEAAIQKATEEATADTASPDALEVLARTIFVAYESGIMKERVAWVCPALALIEV